MSGPTFLAAGTPVDPSSRSLSGRAQIATVLALAAFARAIYWSKRPADMSNFLESWFNHIVRYGPIGAFAHPFSNYEPAYLYLLALGSLAHGLLTAITIIKIISVLGTLFLAIALADLLKAAGAEPQGALLVLILPSVAINDALLGQCDALWAGACLFALAAMIRGQMLRSMVWCGVAIAFKAQAAFMAPVIAGAMIGRRAPLWQWGIPPLVFLATLVPPWLLGWPAIKLLTVYLDQSMHFDIAGRLANPWMIGTIFAEDSSHRLFLVGYAAAGAAALLIAALAARSWRDARLLILLGALSGTVLPFLLPKMLERYYFLGDVMTLALALSWKNRGAFVALLTVQSASILSHIGYLAWPHLPPYPALPGVVFAAVGLVAMCRLAAPEFGSFFASLRTGWKDLSAAAVGPTFRNNR